MTESYVTWLRNPSPTDPVQTVEELHAEGYRRPRGRHRLRVQATLASAGQSWIGLSGDVPSNDGWMLGRLTTQSLVESPAPSINRRASRIRRLPRNLTDHFKAETFVVSAESGVLVDHVNT